ncbi:hypothetical protein J3A83DRAFT_4184552 [Scleroderma citrinum]
MTKIHDEKTGGSVPAGKCKTGLVDPVTTFPEDLEELPNMPDGMSRGGDQEMTKNGGQWQCAVHKVDHDDEEAWLASNTAHRTSEMMGNSPAILSLQKQPKNAVKHQHKSAQNLPQPNRCANTNAQHLNGHPKPNTYSLKQHRLPLEGERSACATNSNAQQSSRQSMPKGHASKLELSKPKIYSPRWHRLLLKGEKDGGATNSYSHSSSR